MKILLIIPILVFISLSSFGQRNSLTPEKKESLKTQQERENYNQLFNKVKLRRDSLEKSWTSLTPEAQEARENQVAYGKTAKMIDMQEAAINRIWIKEHPNSILSLTAIKKLDNPIEMNTAIVDPLFKTLSQSIQSSPEGQTYAAHIALAKSIDIGQPAPDFAAPDSSGKIISLKDFRGKYVFIDFWASWCHWCREENPSILEAYNQYKDKGFVILGVSCDKAQDKAAWLKALKDDHVPWTQISELLAMKGTGPQLYDVHALPKSFLIDPEGKIIARNLRRENLQKKLAELFDKQ